MNRHFVASIALLLSPLVPFIGLNILGAILGVMFLLGFVMLMMLCFGLAAVDSMFSTEKVTSVKNGQFEIEWVIEKNELRPKSGKRNRMPDDARKVDCGFFDDCTWLEPVWTTVQEKTAKGKLGKRIPTFDSDCNTDGCTRKRTTKSTFTLRLANKQTCTVDSSFFGSTRKGQKVIFRHGGLGGKTCRSR